MDGTAMAGIVLFPLTLKLQLEHWQPNLWAPVHESHWQLKPWPPASSDRGVTSELLR